MGTDRVLVAWGRKRRETAHGREGEAATALCSVALKVASLRSSGQTELQCRGWDVEVGQAQHSRSGLILLPHPWSQLALLDFTHPHLSCPWHHPTLQPSLPSVPSGVLHAAPGEGVGAGLGLPLGSCAWLAQ